MAIIAAINAVRDGKLFVDRSWSITASADQSFILYSGKLIVVTNQGDSGMMVMIT